MKPTNVLLEPVVKLLPLSPPIVVLVEPVVSEAKALRPTATFEPPLVKELNDERPTPVFSVPVKVVFPLVSPTNMFCVPGVVSNLVPFWFKKPSFVISNLFAPANWKLAILPVEEALAKLTINDGLESAILREMFVPLPPKPNVELLPEDKLATVLNLKTPLF